MDVQNYFAAKANLERMQIKVQQLSPSLSGILRRGREPQGNSEHAGTREEIEAAVEELKRAMLTVEKIVRSLTPSQREEISIATALKKSAEREKEMTADTASAR